MDLLIIEKRKGVQIQNEIGKIFRAHNIIEFKSPDDNLTIMILSRHWDMLPV